VSVAYDGSQVFTATPDNGYHIANVLIDGVAASAPYTVSHVADNSRTIVASFAPDVVATWLSVGCSPATVDRSGSMTTLVSGKLALDSNHDSGISGKTVTAKYYDPGTTLWLTIGTDTTSLDGSYSISWNVPTTLPNGFHPVKAEFSGDSSSAPQYTETSSVTALPEQGIVVLPEYVLGAVAALGACFLGFAVFKKRNSLPQFRLK
jgi:hypothetical protein